MRNDFGRVSLGVNLIQLLFGIFMAIILFFGGMTAAKGYFVNGSPNSYFLDANYPIQYQLKDSDDIIIPGIPPRGNYRVIGKSYDGGGLTLDVRSSWTRTRKGPQRTQVYSDLVSVQEEIMVSSNSQGLCIQLDAEGETNNLFNLYPNILVVKKANCS